MVESNYDDEEIRVFSEFETATGRKLGVINNEQHGLFRIAYVDGKGGALPESLQGRYTGVKFAEQALAAFVEQTHKIAAEHTKTKRKAEPVVANV
jgi:hypothetical protein